MDALLERWHLVESEGVAYASHGEDDATLIFSAPTDITEHLVALHNASLSALTPIVEEYDQGGRFFVCSLCKGMNIYTEQLLRNGGVEKGGVVHDKDCPWLTFSGEPVPAS
jgi:hypothetical protein